MSILDYVIHALFVFFIFIAALVAEAEYDFAFRIILAVSAGFQFLISVNSHIKCNGLFF